METGCVIVHACVISTVHCITEIVRSGCCSWEKWRRFQLLCSSSSSRVSCFSDGWIFWKRTLWKKWKFNFSFLCRVHPGESDFERLEGTLDDYTMRLKCGCGAEPCFLSFCSMRRRRLCFLSFTHPRTFILQVMLDHCRSKKLALCPPMPLGSHPTG